MESVSHPGQEAGGATLTPWLEPWPLCWVLAPHSLDFLLSLISPEFSLPPLRAGTELWLPSPHTQPPCQALALAPAQVRRVGPMLC